MSASLQLSSSTRNKRFYPQRPYSQAGLTGVLPSSPRYVPSFLSRIGFSVITFQLFMLDEICIEFRQSRSHGFDPSSCHEEKSLAGFEPTTSTSIVTLLIVEPPGTPTFTPTAKTPPPHFQVVGPQKRELWDGSPAAGKSLP